MYIRVVFADSLREETAADSEVPSEIFINPDCPVRVICTLLRDVFRLRGNYQLDLCDVDGNLVFLFDKDPSSSGLKHLKLKQTYYVVIFNEDGYLLKPLRSKAAATEAAPVAKDTDLHWSDIMVKIKKQLKSTAKASKNVTNRPGMNLK